MSKRLAVALIVLLASSSMVAPISIAESTAGQGTDAGLVAHWGFDEGSGNVATDSTPNRNDGLIIPGIGRQVAWGKGKFEGSVYLGGADNQQIRIPASASLNSDKLKAQITVVAHIYPRSHHWTPRPVWKFWDFLPSSAGFVAVVQRQWSTTIHPDLFYLGFGPRDNVLRYKWHMALLGSEASLYKLPEGETEPAVARWVHIAGTYDGETGTMALYVDGKQIGIRTGLTGEIRLDPETMRRPLLIGAELNGPSTDDTSGAFDGYIDDVRVYERALAPAEIQDLFDAAHQRISGSAHRAPLGADDVERRSP